MSPAGSSCSSAPGPLGINREESSKNERNLSVCVCGSGVGVRGLEARAGDGGQGSQKV